MARIDNLTNFLEDIATSIREKKGTEGTILAENFDKEILSIETGSGGDTSDATATADDVLSPKTFYAKGTKLTGKIQTEYESGSKPNITTELDQSSYYVFDFLPSLNIGIIGTSIQPTSVMVCKMLSEGWDMSNAITINKASSNTNITSCKFGGIKTTYDNNLEENVYNILVNGTNNGSYDNHYFRLYRVNLDTMTILRDVDDINYWHSWWTTGQAMYSITANPNKSNEYYMMLVNSYRQDSHGCIKVTISQTGASFAEQNTGGTNPGSNAYCRFSQDGAYVSWYYNGTTLGRIVRTSDNAAVQSGWGMHSIFNRQDNYYVFRNYNFYTFDGTKLTNYTSDYYEFNYTYCYILDNLLVLWNSLKMAIYAFNEKFEVNLRYVSDTPIFPTNTSWKQCRLGYPEYKNGKLVYQLFDDYAVYSIEPKKSDIILRLTIGGLQYIQTVSSTVNVNDVLEGKIAFNKNGKIIGTMPNNINTEFEASIEDQMIPEGYYNGNIIRRVTSDIDINIIPENIRKGATILEVEGSFEGSTGGDATSDGNLQAKYLLEGYSAVVDGKLIEGTMKDYNTRTIIATSEDVTIPEGHYDSLLIPIVNASNCIDYTECKEAILSI